MDAGVERTDAPLVEDTESGSIGSAPLRFHSQRSTRADRHQHVLSHSRRSSIALEAL